VSRIRVALVVLGLALALGSCGGDGGGENASDAARGATAVTGPTQTPTVTAPTEEGEATSEDRKSSSSGETGGTENRDNESSREPAEAETQARDRPRSKNPRSKTRRAPKKGGTKIWGNFTKRGVYENAKATCRQIGLAQVAAEWVPGATDPVDVAKGYAEAFIKAGAPEAVRVPTWQGCLEGLTR
jgi:hypothetical protein